MKTRPTTRPTQYRMLNTEEQYKLLKLIEANGEKRDGFWVYSQGWTDERIAAESGIEIATVRRRRQQVFGNTRLKIAKRDAVALLEKRIAALEAIVNRLETASKRPAHINGEHSSA